MATDFTVFSRQYMKSSPLDSDVKMITSPNLIRASTAEANVLVPIPWENVRLVKAAAVVTVAVDPVAWEIDLELNAAGGTEMMTISVAKSATVGLVYEATVSNQAACERLSAVEGTRDSINIELSAAAGTPTGACTIYFIFEPELDSV